MHVCVNVCVHACVCVCVCVCVNVCILILRDERHIFSPPLSHLLPLIIECPILSNVCLCLLRHLHAHTHSHTHTHTLIHVCIVMTSDVCFHLWGVRKS